MQPQCGRRWCSRNFLQNQMEEGLVSRAGGRRQGKGGQLGEPRERLRRVMQEEGAGAEEQVWACHRRSQGVWQGVLETAPLPPSGSGLWNYRADPARAHTVSATHGRRSTAEASERTGPPNWSGSCPPPPPE